MCEACKMQGTPEVKKAMDMMVKHLERINSFDPEDRSVENQKGMIKCMMEGEKYALDYICALVDADRICEAHERIKMIYPVLMMGLRFIEDYHREFMRPLTQPVEKMPSA